MQPGLGRQANRLAEGAAEMALVGKAGIVRRLGQCRAFAQELLGKIDPAVLQIAIGAGAKQCPEIARKLPAVTVGNLFKFLQSRTVNDGGIEEFARPHHGRLVGDPDGCSLAGHRVHRLRQIVECILIGTGIFHARAVNHQGHGCRDQGGIGRDAIGHKRQLRAAQRCLHVGWRNIGGPIAEASLIVAVSQDLTSRIRAGDLVAALALHVDGKGGGRADQAMAGGSKPEGLPQALAAVVPELTARLAVN